MNPLDRADRDRLRMKLVQAYDALEDGHEDRAEEILRGAVRGLPQPQADTNDRWRAESWATFRSKAADDLDWLIPGLLPAGALMFIASPPKAGKTWLALVLALCLATGRPVFGEYQVPEPCDVLYVALEGARAGLRARIGALARGLGIDPDSDELDRLTIAYRPRPFDLIDLETAKQLEAEAGDARLVVIDVLRQAARIKENDSADFGLVRDAIEPLLAEGRTVPILHHFGKWNDTQAGRTPGERMAGTGAMFGALDLGFYITKSESGARRLRVDVDARDFATPDPLGVVIAGTGSGEHGGFTYHDTALVVLDETATEGRDLVAELEQLFADGRWRTETELASKKDGLGANKDEIRAALEGTPDRFVRVDGPRAGRHATAKPWGTIAMLEKVAQPLEPPEPPLAFREMPSGGGAGGSPKGESHRATCSQPPSELAPAAEPPPPAAVPLPGDDGFVDFLEATVNGGHVSQAEAFELYQVHKAIVGELT